MRKDLAAMPISAVETLRSICLALPEAAEEPMRRGPSYRVRDKIFALERDHRDGPALWCKVPEGSQAVLVGADPERFFVPPYFGPKGWIGMRLSDAPDWNEAGFLVRRSYRLIAPKRLAALVP